LAPCNRGRSRSASNHRILEEPPKRRPLGGRASSAPRRRGTPLGQKEATSRSLRSWDFLAGRSRPLSPFRSCAAPPPHTVSPVALSILKLPAGALTGITGLVLLYGKFVPGLSELDSQGQILAYAIVLGIAQHLVTRFVDQKAEDVLGSVPSKQRSPTGAQPPAEATQPSAPTATTLAATPARVDRA
jgi:hypothetical protein